MDKLEKLKKHYETLFHVADKQDDAVLNGAGIDFEQRQMYSERQRWVWILSERIKNS